MHGLYRFFRGENEIEEDPMKKGPMWCDNRSAITSVKKKNLADVPKRTRHIALRYVQLRDEASRICFVPTHMQRADALTKAGTNGLMYKNLFHAQNMKRFENAEANVVFCGISSVKRWYNYGCALAM